MRRLFNGRSLCSATNNSGIQYRSEPIRKESRNAWVVAGYQHEVRNEVGLPNVAGFIYDEAGRAWAAGDFVAELPLCESECLFVSDFASGPPSF